MPAHCSWTPGRCEGLRGVLDGHLRTSRLAGHFFAASPLGSPTKPVGRAAGAHIAFSSPKRPPLQAAPSGSPAAPPPRPRWTPPEAGRRAVRVSKRRPRWSALAPAPRAVPGTPFLQVAANAAASRDPTGRQQTLCPPAQKRFSQSLRGRAHSLPALGTRPPAPLRRWARGELRAARDAPGVRHRRRRPRPSATARSLRLPLGGRGLGAPGGGGRGTSPTCGGAGPLPAARQGSAPPLGARAPAGSRRQLMETFPGGAPGEQSAPASPGAAVVSRARTGVTWASERASCSHPAAH